jgi:hypothetical protein
VGVPARDYARKNQRLADSLLATAQTIFKYLKSTQVDFTPSKLLDWAGLTGAGLCDGAS